MKKKPKEMLKLVEFLSIYNIFVDDGEENEEKKEDEEKDKESNNIKEKIDNTKYVHKNAHRKFIQDNIDYIEEISSGLADIIIEELHQSITNFFTKKDKNNQGYITLNEFKDILEHDLKIDYKSDIDNLQIFFDFVTSDKMIEGEDIIEIKKLIKVLTTYSGRDKPEKLETENNNTNNKKSVLFEEEEDIQGTNAPNINNNITSPRKLSEGSDQIKKDASIELINTQINTSIISFDKIISDFAHFLFSNRIRFGLIFPSINLQKVINNQTISDETLRLGFQNANYPISDKEFSVVMTHFDPINKSKVSVENLKHEISKYEPKYFTQSYQKIDPDEIETKLMIKSQELEKSATTNRKNVFNTNLLNGMDKIKNYIERNNLSIENFLFGIFCGKNPKNENLLINQETWKNNFVDNDKTKEIIIPNLKNEELDAIFY